ncbi:RNA polymerase subunit sigma-24 [Kribbella qitaiheensis]|uniref:RNA polymerase subunit sigma-24 n=1 Tax=Kribbella qitaiheensis TaxID=1544730 RepID=A0A7G6WUC1_9ACTN|nr:sigma factor-like helix-turn-helix DNA-binding protein [Kribbella qitaiheensis]QNE17586.1 RNA polymerase subunit sigma-24 [Kribbella qitaiheensis]
MRDIVDPEFASYVDARQGKWLRAAYLVYADLDRAEEQLRHAFTRLALRWGRVDDPDVFVQRILYDAALSRWSRAKPPVLEEDDDSPVRSALATLSPVQRAVFVLLYLEELTEFEVADVLNLSHTTVHGHGLAALSQFRTALGAGDDRDTRRRDWR